MFGNDPSLENEPPQTDAEVPPGSPPPTRGGGARATNAGRVWIATGVAVIVLVLLIIFIAENSRHVTISFLGAKGSLSTGLALLIAAVAGAAVTVLAGTARILQLRREVRRHRRRLRRT